MFKSTIFHVNFMIFLIFIHKTNAICCAAPFVVSHFCRDVPGEKANNSYDGICDSKICMDGKPISGYFCGKGACNMFGCNCDDGCLTNYLNTKEEAVRLFVNKYYVIMYEP